MIHDSSEIENEYKQDLQEELKTDEKLLKSLENENIKEEEKEKIQNSRIRRIKLIKQESSENDDYFNQLIYNNDNKNSEIQEETIELESNEDKNEQQENKKDDKLILHENQLKIEIKSDADNLLFRLSEAIEEYRKVIDYFAKNNLSSSLEEARIRAKKINEALTKLKNGEEINEFSLCLLIEPEFICGMTKEEKCKKYKELLAYYLTEKKEKTQKLKELLGFYKSQSKSKIKKNIDSMKRNLDKLKNEIEEIDKTIKNIKEYQGNIWMPFPEIIKSQNEKVIEHINKDVSENKLLIQVNVIDKPLKNNLILHLIIDNFIDEMISLKKKTNDLLYNNQFQLNNNCRSIIRKDLALQIIDNGCCNMKLILYEKRINLNALGVFSTLKFTETFLSKKESK